MIVRLLLLLRLLRARLLRPVLLLLADLRMEASY